MYVVDNWTFCDDDVEWERFFAAWRSAFVESSNVLEAENDFCGVRYDDMPDGSLELSCGKLLAELENMIGRFPDSAGTETPMLCDSLQRMRESSGPLLRSCARRAFHCWARAVRRARSAP